ncbi:SDR family oxidoreductase [Parachlamydia sp. AcF125]|uniref:SDR family NAD(P)-dependent oxidoreductase n=1 Tax=Parachlamydia sp. AcF125 TaxID=2795736 RepID=UPI001BCA4F25|nr:SDR family oxidoreductase [Parachlamydia sp. AcF125]MBS4168924.1 3-oxoacyl-[acyl-carrier-protein] reductase FabG [Parachlamydia sp. AcF125]
MSWILVTGAAKGLGAEICHQLAKEGHSVVIHYRTSRDGALQTAERCKQLGGKAEVIQGDFSSDQSLREFIHNYQQRFPHTEGLVNNVGNYLVKPALSTSLQEWNDLFQTNLTAPFFLIHELIPSLKKHQGSIVNIGSAGTHAFLSNSYSSIYHLTKTSLWMLTKNLAKELASDLVRVNMVSPGQLENSVDPLHYSRLPMKRYGTLAEVAAVVTFLMHKQNSYITGQNIEVTGGLHV